MHTYMCNYMLYTYIYIYIRTEELSLDDLLALDDAPPAPRPAPRAGGGSPKAAPK